MKVSGNRIQRHTPSAKPHNKKRWPRASKSKSKGREFRHQVTFPSQHPHFWGQRRFDHAIIAAIGVGSKSIGMIIGFPLAVDQITKFASATRGQVNRHAPNAVPILAHGGGALVPPIKITHQKNTISPDTGWQFECDLDMIRNGGRRFVDHEFLIAS